MTLVSQHDDVAFHVHVVIKYLTISQHDDIQYFG
jgi:hypothetical protein